ncbi:MAG: hypothetical protein EOO29_11585 [Comamonadaceae bacterium]|nr:MAG: hypothetical protein EOO29_11585 [Comamonadaceae bacterium]
MTDIAAPTALQSMHAERVDFVSDASLVQWAKELAAARRMAETPAVEGHAAPVQSHGIQQGVRSSLGAAGTRSSRPTLR